MAKQITDEKALHDALVAVVGDEIVGESRGVSVRVKVARLSLYILVRAAVYGIQKILMDSVSGFKDKPEAEIRERMLKRAESLYAGEWQDRTARLFSVCRGVLEDVYPKAEIPAKGTWALRDRKSLDFWCGRMHALFPSDKLPQGPKPESVIAKAEKIIREREAEVDDLA